MSVSEFLNQDMKRIEDLVEKHPRNIPVNALAEFLNVSLESVRGAIVSGNYGFWYQNTINKRGFTIPTGNFVRWYLRVKVA